MCQRSSLTPIVVAMLVGVVAAARPASADDVASYLERYGLTQLLAVHLEQLVESANGEERRELIVRLSGLYAELLESVDDPVARKTLEERGRRLLRSAPSGSADTLELALLRATYRAVERAAENHRLALASAEDVENAKTMLAELIPDLHRLRRRLTDRAETNSRRLSRASGTEATLLAEETERGHALAAQATFLAAWSLYYQSWLHERGDNAQAAQRLFIDLLDFGHDTPVPENVSVDLRGTEAIARCILGMALCKSLTASTATAMSWLTLLEHDAAYAPVRTQVPAWRLVVRLEADEFEEAADELSRLRDAGTPPPVHWLRLVAVAALEAQDRSRRAAELARTTVTELATRGELQQVFDLAHRYGTSSLGADGFALLYVNGILEYHAARATHDGDEPTRRSDVVAMYEDAIAFFTRALDASDAAAYPEARPDCRRLTGWARYFQGEFLEARTAFLATAEATSGAAAAEALWMAIICLDQLVDDDRGGEALRAELTDLTNRFLREFPASEHTPKLLLRRAMADENASPSVAAELLAVPSNSSVYEAARKRAAQILYQLFRNARGSERTVFGEQYLEAAVELLGEPGTASDLPVSERRRFLARARRVLEVTLADGVERLGLARRVFGRLADLRAADEALFAGLDDELAYRRVQERLLSGDTPAATSEADALYDRAAASIWTRLASRGLYRAAHATWRGGGPAAREARGRVIKYGQRVIDEYTDATATGFLGYATAVADARMASWQDTKSLRDADAALELYDRLLTVRPGTASFLRATAILAAALGEEPRAVECWRRLVAGLPQESDGWYEAKYELIVVLSSTDPERAAAVIGQHRDLHPEYGPAPWGARLKALDDRLRRDTGSDTRGGTGE
ncbi:MAG: hypothetical protein HKO59_04980 [Phycisphaerales bacterium]|nr:hypothetical protein [Phycisphaerales bacterium]